MVAVARLVLIEERRQCRRVEQARTSQHRPEHRITKPPTQRSSKPLGKRHSEALLRAVQYVLRDVRFESGFEDELTLATTKKEAALNSIVKLGGLDRFGRLLTSSIPPRSQIANSSV